MPQAAAQQAPKLLHIFKPGRWTTMAGETIEFSQADLAASAQAFDPKVAKAPIVIGHPATDDPAQGWVAGLVANERGLFVQPSHVDPAFAQAVKAGRYGTVSAKFYRPTDPNNPKPGVWYLRHLGFLGARDPAVTGLDDPAFAGPHAGTDTEAAAGVCFSAGVDLDAQAAAEFSATTPTPQESTMTKEEEDRLRAENAAQAAQIANLQAAQRAAQKATVHATHVAFCAPLQGVPADWRDRVVAVADHLADQTQEVAFGTGDSAVPLIDVFKGFLAALPAPVASGEHATRDRAAGAGGAADESAGAAFAAPAGFAVDPDALALHAKVQAHAKEKGISYDEALAALR